MTILTHLYMHFRFRSFFNPFEVLSEVGEFTLVSRRVGSAHRSVAKHIKHLNCDVIALITYDSKQIIDLESFQDF